jgi:hypothetical protein
MRNCLRRTMARLNRSGSRAPRTGSHRRRVAHWVGGARPWAGIPPGAREARGVSKQAPWPVRAKRCRSGRSLRRTRKASAAARSQHVWPGSRARHGLGDRGHVALRARERVSPGRKASAESMLPVASKREDGSQSVGAISRHANERAGLARPAGSARVRAEREPCE